MEVSFEINRWCGRAYFWTTPTTLTTYPKTDTQLWQFLSNWAENWWPCSNPTDLLYDPQLPTFTRGLLLHPLSHWVLSVRRFHRNSLCSFFWRTIVSLALSASIDLFVSYYH